MRYVYIKASDGERPPKLRGDAGCSVAVSAAAAAARRPAHESCTSVRGTASFRISRCNDVNVHVKICDFMGKGINETIVFLPVISPHHFDAINSAARTLTYVRLPNNDGGAFTVESSFSDAIHSPRVDPELMTATWASAAAAVRPSKIEKMLIVVELSSPPLSDAIIPKN